MKTRIAGHALKAQESVLWRGGAMRKILLFLPVIAVLGAAEIVEAQQPIKIYRVGYLGMSRREGQQPREEAFAAGMRDLGL